MVFGEPAAAAAALAVAGEADRSEGLAGFRAEEAAVVPAAADEEEVEQQLALRPSL